MNRHPYGTGLLVAVVAVAIYTYLVPFGSTRRDYASAFDEPLADDRVECGDESFALTTSPWRLPNGMRDVLGGSEMSSPGGPFNAGDVGDGPRSRFGVAALGRRHIFVAVEHGGIGYGVGFWAFKRDDFFHWVGHPMQMPHAGQVPQSLPQLLALTCKP